MQQYDVYLPKHRRVRSPAAFDLAALRALRSATKPDWTTAVAAQDAQSVLEAARGDTGLLRQARMQIIERFPPSKSRIGSRAILTLTFALAAADQLTLAEARSE